ncbi:hypothetical protein K431DRAFT_287265 [Polychaeton citri CBS 116435]|uniref:Uncharacterized protein n=1 Tax=Polychaeton citri CBS 116435 TaxID=1314669 RepID=A0A9P4UNA6_9PEZI|nr:hypothetical protein K431DRAFT_287265 [Polychaeton citri CBS 116435]
MSTRRNQFCREMWYCGVHVILEVSIVRTVTFHSTRAQGNSSTSETPMTKLCKGCLLD